MIRTEMGGGTISLNMGPISLGILGLVGGGGGRYISNDMGLPGPMSLGKWGRGGGGGGAFHYYIVQSYLKSYR